MRVLRPITEDEMIAVFLRAELESERFGDKLRGIMARDGVNFVDADAAYRRRLLEEPRAPRRAVRRVSVRRTERAALTRRSRVRVRPWTRLERTGDRPPRNAQRGRRLAAWTPPKRYRSEVVAETSPHRGLAPGSAHAASGPLPVGVEPRRIGFFSFRVGPRRTGAVLCTPTMVAARPLDPSPFPG